MMTKKFDALITSFLADQIGIVEDFLEPNIILGLRNNLMLLHKDSQFHKAQVGSKENKNLNLAIRSDEVYWLDKMHNNADENTFFNMIDAFVLFLNQTCYAGIKSYEFQYAKYDEGAFYVRHRDEFRNNSDRVYTMIIYLNENWLQGDGGELCAYTNVGAQIITPLASKCVFFGSKDLEHEVLVNHKARYSISGWFKTA
jgi:SM-20-related protein